jgi:hypothetical protein
MEDLGVDGTIILKWVLVEQGVTVWAGSFWFRMPTYSVSPSHSVITDLALNRCAASSEVNYLRLHASVTDRKITGSLERQNAAPRT